MDINSIVVPMLSLGSMALIFGVGLGFAGVKFKVEEDERLPEVRSALPGANCGGCGFAGCDAFAAAVLDGRAKLTGCPVGGASCAENISNILGLNAEQVERKEAFVQCGGDCNKSTYRYEYFGMAECSAITHLAGGGNKSCAYSCVGGGTCVRACMFDALHIVDGIAVVDKEKCTACGMCVTICPKSLIELVPSDAAVKVRCHSRDNGKVVRSHCQVGCIACKMCEKACEYDAVHINNNLAKIDYEKCTACNACVLKCPMHTILSESHSVIAQ